MPSFIRATALMSLEQVETDMTCFPAVGSLAPWLKAIGCLIQENIPISPLHIHRLSR